MSTAPDRILNERYARQQGHQIGVNDEYLLATPEREAAEENARAVIIMRKALVTIGCGLSCRDEQHALMASEIASKAVDEVEAIAKIDASGEGEAAHGELHRVVQPAAGPSQPIHDSTPLREQPKTQTHLLPQREGATTDETDRES